MIVNGTNFGPIWGASGVEGFFGEGYRHHRYYKAAFPRRFTFEGVTFVAKTVTLHPRPGNMPLQANGTTTKEFLPDCIRTNPAAGAVLNAVGLSNSGVEFYLDDGRWQERSDPFVISFMCMGKTAEERADELSEFVDLMIKRLPRFRAPIALQQNFSCPNTGHELDELVREVSDMLDIGSRLEVPQAPKFNVLLPPEQAATIAENKHCSAICTSNTIPWGKLPDKIDWKGLFGSDISPLAKYGGGGLSGAPLTEIVKDWIRSYDCLKPRVKLNAGGGIMSPADVRALSLFPSVRSVFVGSVAVVRPWRLQAIIKEARRIF